MTNLIEKLANIIAVGAMLYAILQIAQSLIHSFGGVHIEFFTETINNSIYVRVSTGIENVILLKNTFDTFKKETKFSHFNKALFDQLLEQRNKTKQKLTKEDIQSIFTKIGKNTVMPSIN